MDLAVILPLAVLLFTQVVVSALLLAPRALSKHIAMLVSATRTQQVASTVLYTVAVAVAAMTASSLIQLSQTLQSMHKQQFGDRCGRSCCCPTWQHAHALVVKTTHCSAAVQDFGPYSRGASSTSGHCAGRGQSGIDVPEQGPCF